MRCNVKRKMGIRLLFAGSLCCLPSAPPPACAQTLAELRAARKAAFEPRALLLLNQMAEAYTHLTDFDQKTEFFSLQTPLFEKKGEGEGKGKEEEKKAGRAPAAPPSYTVPNAPVERRMERTIRLLVSFPNRMRVEMSEGSAEDGSEKTAVSVSDGKIFWNYNPEKNWYTREKAPRKLRDILKAISLNNATLELMLMLGVNPFGNLDAQFDAAHYDGSAVVMGVNTDVVLLRVLAEQQTQELRFYIGKDDMLLRRLVVESITVARPVTAPVKDPLDDLIAHRSDPPPLADPNAPQAPPNSAPPNGFEDPQPLAAPGVPIKTRVTCNNIFTTAPRFEYNAFAFEPPKGAVLYQSINGQNDFSKMSNALTIQDLLKQANKHKKTKPVRLKP